jgi:hypothetical protein
MQLFLVVLLLTCSIFSNASCSKAFKQVQVNANDQTFTLLSNAPTNPQILVTVIIRNNAYSLPTFLRTLETIKCPNAENRCDLWIAFDKCTDKSYDIFVYWLSHAREMFNSILMLNTDNDVETKKKHVRLFALMIPDELAVEFVMF